MGRFARLFATERLFALAKKSNPFVNKETMTDRTKKAGGIPSVTVVGSHPLYETVQFNSAAARIAPYWIMAFDEDMTLLNYNEAAFQLLGAGKVDLEKPLPPAHYDKVRDCFRSQRVQKMVWEYQEKTYEVIYRYYGKNDCVFVFGHEVTGHVQDRADLLRESHRDRLTLLSNREGLVKYVNETLAPERKYRYGMMLIDVDHFKSFNDDFQSHSVGDRVLVEIAERLQNVSHGGDFVARLQGDEFVFVVVLPNSMSDQEIRQRLTKVADRILAKIRQPIRVKGMPSAREITVTIGIAVDTPNARKLEKILDQSDCALYAATQGGRNQYAFFEPAMTKKK